MGLFDFVSSIGKAIFGTDAEASDKIRDYINSENPGV